MLITKILNSKTIFKCVIEKDYNKVVIMFYKKKLLRTCHHLYK